ncbi:MAG: acetyl-CoA acetyltransferase [Actinomycetia bacterium]|nr:acetyl-CoA acetyltransferase [Actinomycetes bacterium]
MAEALRRAAADSGASGVLDAAESVRVVALLSRRYGDPAALVASSLGLGDVQTVLTTDGGNSPSSLLGRTSQQIVDGELDVALLCGGEAWATRTAARRAGTDLDWVTQPDGVEPDVVLGSPLDMWHPAEAALDIKQPVEVYPLFEQALRARLGRTDEEHRAVLGALWSRFSQVAAANPDAADRAVRTADEITTPGPGNRLVSWPYTKLLCSNEQVDQGAGLIVCSVAAARRLGIPAERWVFPVATAEAKDVHVSERWDLATSPMVGAAGRLLWSMAGVGADDVGLLDLYSCFPSAVEVQAAELGIGLHRDLTVTGGMRFFGGPWNDYPMHAFVTMVQRLRAEGGLGLVTGNGGYITKQAATLLSATPPAQPFRLASAQAEVDALPTRGVADEGTGVVETFTVSHDRNGPTRGVVAALLPDERRCWGLVTEPAAMADLLSSDPIGQPVTIEAGVAHLH